jgi:hypothetical protein
VSGLQNFRTPLTTVVISSAVSPVGFDLLGAEPEAMEAQVLMVRIMVGWAHEITAM